MPNLEELQFSVSVEKWMKNNVVSFEGLGLDYLPSIRRVKVDFWCDGAFKEDVEREEAALTDAIQVHPNRPALQTHHLGIYKKSYDDCMQPTGTSGTGHDKMKMNTPPLVQTCDEEWILDAGAMEHCTSDQRLLHKDSRDDDHIGWIGSVETERFKVPRVHYIPGAEMKNVISVSKLAEDHGLEVVFEPACCYVRDPVTGKDVGRGRQRNGVYMLHSLLIGNPQDVLPSGSGAQELRDYGRSARKLKWPDDASWFGRTTRFGRAGYPTEDVFTGSSPHEEQRGTRTAEFYMDSCVCHHMTWNGDVLKAYHETLQIKPPIKSVTIGAENIQSAVNTDQLPRPLQVLGIGYIDSTGGLLDRVLLVPDSTVNLVSVNQLTVDYSVRVVFHQDEFLIEKLESKERIGHGKRVGSNYVVAVLDPCNWVLDSSAWVHQTTNREILDDLRETAEHPQILGNGSIRTERFNVPDVRYIAGDARNVISVAQLADDHGMVTIFEPKFCYIKEKETGEIVGEGYLRDGVYVLNSLRVNQDKTGEQGEGPGQKDSGASGRDGQGGSDRDGGSIGGEDGKKGGRGQGQAARGGSGGGGEKEGNDDKKMEGDEEEQEEDEEEKEEEEEEEEEDKVDKEEEAEEVVKEEIEEEMEGGEDEGNIERENEIVGGDQTQEFSQSEPPLFDSSTNVGRAYFASGLAPYQHLYIVDSGATHHMTRDKDLLRSFYMDKRNPKFPKDKIQSVQIAEKKILVVDGFGNLNKDGIKVDDLLYVPDHVANLISVSQLVAQLSQQLEERLRLREVARQLEAMAMPKLLTKLISCQREVVVDDLIRNLLQETSVTRAMIMERVYRLVDGINLSDDSKERIVDRLASQFQALGVHQDQICKIAEQLKDMSVPQLELDVLAGQLEDLAVQHDSWIQKLGTHLLALDLMLNDLAPQLQALCVSLTPHRIKEFADQHEALLTKPELQYDRLAPLLQGMGVPQYLIEKLEYELQFSGVPQLRVDELASQLEAMRVPQGLIDELTTHLEDMSMPQAEIWKVATELKDMGVSQLRTDDLVDYLQTLGMKLQIEDIATNLRAHGVTLLQTNELARELQALGAPWLLIDQIVRQLDDVGVVVEQQRVDQLVAKLRDVNLVDHFVSQDPVEVLKRQLSCMGVPQLLTGLLKTVGKPWSSIKEIASQIKPVVPLSVGDFDITVGNHKVGSGTKPRGGLYQIKELGPCPLVQLSVKHGEWVLTEIP